MRGVPATVDHAEIIANPEMLDAVISEVLTESFSSDETGTVADLTERIRAGAYQVTALTDFDQVAAVAVTEDDPSSGVTLLAYLAARPGLRGHGHGGELLDGMRRRWSSEGAFVVAELHDPTVWPVTDTDDPPARIRFYARHGAEVLDCTWTQPPLSASTAAVPHMLLAVLARPTGGGEVPSGPIAAWARRYMDDTHWHPRTQAFIDDLAHRDTIAVARLEELSCERRRNARRAPA